MKKLYLVLSTLLLVGCANEIISNQSLESSYIQSNIQSSLNTKSGYTLALKEAKKLLKTPQLFEIDVWKETGSEEVFHYGFMQKIDDGSHKFIRIIINPKTKELSNENLNDNLKVPNPVDIKNWKIDYDKVLSIAKANGLTDSTYLATLWEDTWHISGLKQTLYFQLDSKDGKIKMICTDPYLTSCTDSNMNPTKNNYSSDVQKKFVTKKSK